MTISNRRRPITERRWLLLPVLLAGAGCQTAPAPPPQVSVEVIEQAPWRRVASSDDVARLDQLASAWSDRLAAARRAGHARRIAAEGALLEPGVSLPQALLPPGSYRCRVLRLAGSSRRTALIVFPTHFCHVGHDGEHLSLIKQTGTERPGGYLWEDRENRMIFLGADALGSEQEPPAYGANRRRDVVGVVERVGPFRYRVAMLRMAPAAELDVLELVPAPAQN